ncbi:mannose-1-phosphate guanylyltransferase/mannose-6-phosphate isomerase [Niveispirillum sp. SYP-B3756]|uniref:mannose-1-phosphate guanylyltransferase/mannose-6-phosphate isomerase n=1 Tax=Niveispirillum sp. SYP-B3756 TaxID=2662178 RepID=UPI0012908D8D|nr:mannose-1-phosphate guanylyltransferase/mannose-6-phosphate isomerase [Niveispirillum sp. SYP-B3756]MQP64927.1 mannose-1-phosphate guanylyltransferase/mannose-6-phosphate isomerase [Niveispirillum sp. SYP-B3756]
MTALQVTPVILSGGSGTRLWPASRSLHPKQFLPLAGDLTMIQETALRVQGDEFASPLMICNEEHRFILAEQMRTIQVEPAAILLEPVGRNTAPAIALAALKVMESGGDPLLLVMPSDHVVADVAGFRKAVGSAVIPARDGALVTFGIRPDRPETGYGYIKMGQALTEGGTAHPVDRFVEKPDAATAATYLAEGCYLWNSGIFLFAASTYLAELERQAPAILAACRAALAGATTDLTFCRVSREAFAASPSVSVDYAVMEKTTRAVVVPVDMGWNDVGAWSALWDIGAKDPAGNVGIGDVLLHDCSNSYVRADGRLVAVAGLSDVVVVASDDAVLVAHRDRAQDIKAIVERLKKAHRPECDTHTTLHRPWGYHRTIDAGERYQVKRVVVQPGEQLSLQRHNHRAEHWVVVQGTAEVICGEDVRLIHENQSVYIPIGEKHRLGNPGRIPLHLIEVRSGSYLGEDDIVRFADKYTKL